MRGVTSIPDAINISLKRVEFDYMKIAATVARYLFIVCIPLMLLTGVIAVAINSTWLYTAASKNIV